MEGGLELASKIFCFKHYVFDPWAGRSESVGVQ